MFARGISVTVPLSRSLLGGGGLRNGRQGDEARGLIIPFWPSH